MNDKPEMRKMNDIYYSTGEIPRYGPYSFTMNIAYDFLKQEFPREASYLKLNDENAIRWEGFKTGAHPDAIRSAWMRAYNRVGSHTFEDILDLYISNQILHLLRKFADKENSIIDVDSTDSSLLIDIFEYMYFDYGSFDALYEALNKVIENEAWSYNGLTISEFLGILSEAEVINPHIRDWAMDMLKASPEEDVKIVGYVKEEVKEEEVLTEILISNLEEEIEAEVEEEPEIYIPVIKKMNGTIKVVSRDESVNIKNIDTGSERKAVYGDTFKVIGITVPQKEDEEALYQIDDNEFITTDDKFVILLDKEDEVKVLYSVRIKSDSVVIKLEPSDDCEVEAGPLKKNQVFSIIEEENGYGKLKSGSGWIKIDENVKKIKR